MQLKESPPPSLVLAWLAIAVLVGYLMFVGGAGAGTSWAGLRLVSVALCAGAFAIWLAVAWRRPSWRPRSALAPALTVALSAFAISTWLSWEPRLSLEMSAYAVVLSALYLLLVRILAVPHFRARVGPLILCLFVVIAGLYLVRVVSSWARWWEMVGPRVPPLRPGYDGLLFGNPNELAAIALLTLLPSLAFLGTATRPRRIGSAVLMVVGVGVVLISGSRGAWLGVVTAVLVSAAALTIMNWGTDAHGSREARGRRLWPTVAVLGVVLTATLVLAPSVVARLEDGGGGTLRLTFAASALAMFESSPLTGSGPGTWAVRRAAVTPAGAPDLYVPHAHDVYLQGLAEFGLLTVVVGVVLGWGLLRLVISAGRDQDPMRRRFAVAAAFGLGFLAGQQLVDFALNIPAVLFATAVPIAWLDATRPQRSAGPPSIPRRSLALAASSGFVAIAALSLAVLAWSESTSLSGEAAVSEANAGRWDRAYVTARQVVATDGGVPVYWFTAGLAAAHVGELQFAADSFLHAAERDDFPIAWLNLAAVEYDLGLKDQAIRDLDRALRLGRSQASVALPAGALFMRMGDRVGAVDAFSAALQAAPSLAGDLYWSSTQQLATVYPSVVAGAIARSEPWTAFEVALYANDQGATARTIGGLDSTDRPLAQMIRAARSGDPGLAALVDAATRQPEDVRLLGWCARVAADRGDVSATETCRTLLGVVDASAQFAVGYDLRVVRGAVGGPPEAWASGGYYRYYGLYLYRRPTPADWLVPGLPGVALDVSGP